MTVALRNLSEVTHGVFCTMIETVEENPCWSFENPAPIHTTTMKILAATIMSTKLVINPKQSNVGTYCSARDDRNTTLSRSPIVMMSPQ